MINQNEDEMRSHFEAGLQERVRRASDVSLQNIIPNHWFSSAASECAGMYISGYFYGAISVAQAYVEALSKYLAKFHKTGVKNDVLLRCDRLFSEKIISQRALDAAKDIFNNRNDFHHLNENIQQDKKELELRAKNCINNIHIIESEVFEHSFSNGKVVLVRPEYWPSPSPDLTTVHLRQLW